nr:hypothetical protein [Tanacetum cinerariifolium]
MTINYLEYEVKMERRLRNVQFKISPTKAQSTRILGLISGIIEIKPHSENMTINYLEYEVEMERRLRNVQFKISPKKYEGADFDSFHQNKLSTNVSDDVDIESMTIVEYNIIEAEDLKRIGQENFQNSICEQNVVNISKLKEEEAQVKDGDHGDNYDIWDITVEDRQLLTPNLLDVMDDVIQPSIPKNIHNTPPDGDYVAHATKLILDERLEEFEDEILNVTMVDEEADFNPIKDIEDLERLLANNPRSHFTEIQAVDVKMDVARGSRLGA